MAKTKYLKARKFRLHFNRINMQRGLLTVWTIHRSDRCIPARKIKCYVELETRYDANGRQPRAVLCGEGIIVDCQNNDYAIMTPQLAFALMLQGRDEKRTVKIV